MKVKRAVHLWKYSLILTGILKYVTFSKGKSETHSCLRFQKKKKKKEKERKTFKDHEYHMERL